MATTKTETTRIDVNNGKWRVFTERLGWSDETRVWVGQYSGSNFANATVGEDGRLVLTVLKEGESPASPLMVLPTPVWQLIVDAIAEKTPPAKKEALDAELAATKYHLEDMRQLVFSQPEEPHVHTYDDEEGGEKN